MRNARRLIVTVSLSIGLLVLTAARADQTMLELATHSGCFICHSITSNPTVPTPLAPSYEAIAARYQDDRGVFDELVDRVLHGTVYKEQHWADAISMRFMPPNVNIERQDAAALVDWILAMNPGQTDDALIQHEANLALAAISGCLTCHGVAPVNIPRAVPLAPSFKEIAAYYDGKAGAEPKLLKSVLDGTLNREKIWTQVNMQFMPPNVALRQTDAEQLVKWILDLDHKGIRVPK